jgi:hypothetical protein
LAPFRFNQYDAYSLNSVTAKKDTDGEVAVQFGRCDGKIANCLPTTPGWNYVDLSMSIITLSRGSHGSVWTMRSSD